MLRWRTLPSLYTLALRSLVERAESDIRSLAENLPGFVKDDLLKAALRQGKCRQHISHFLHPRTTTLDISDCKVTDQELVDISNCVCLQVLEMNPPKYSRFYHSTSTLSDFFSRLRNLSRVHVQRNDGMTDLVVSTISTHCLGLRELDVSGCTNLTDETLIALSTLSHLRAVDLSSTNVGDVGLIALSKGKSAKCLSILKLNNCARISDHGVQAVVRNCGNISKLVFCNCPRVSVECQLALASLWNKDTAKPLKLVTWTLYL